MASEFLADASERLIHTMRALGISQQVAGMVAAEWQASVTRDWGGERPYIGKQAAAAVEMSRRDAAICRDWQAGERMGALSRKYQISRQRIYLIVSQAPR
ncbi:Mor transcription activator family protein [Comamonas aquatica]|uniref:Mor transcription activator family protein n=1 Tax=Comamonas aquatica TaxID=225991 RepID=UPI0021B125A0|nr:Mor transcription activator family protein [Comamonas aquatica]MDH1900887.1 hypothetical protein [Comamonas aquatica]